MLSIFFAYILDLIFGDPHWLPHPVRGIGGLIQKAEGFLRRRFRNLKAAGALLALFTVAITYLGVKFVIWDAGLFHSGLKALASIILIYFAISVKDLKCEAGKIYECLKKSQLEKARQQASRIVGRDTKELDSEQVIRAAVESVAESTIDGVVSVLFYAFIGGPVLVWVYKAVNTLDSMVGYKNPYYKDIGWFSAKLDDAFNYIPSRISILLIPIASYLCRMGFAQSFSAALKDGLKHPSPNSGIPEAAFAGALGVQLGGLSYYNGLPVHNPYLGNPRNKLQPEHIKEAVRLMYAASALLVAVLIVINYLWNYIL